MVSRPSKNFLPKKLMDGVAPKTLVSQHRLLRLRGLKKPIIFKFSKLTKLALGSFLALYFLGYQPTMAIPPVKKSLALADFSQEQQINPAVLSEAFKLPHPGYLTTRFSHWHPGIDIAAGLGMPVHPVAKGTVAEVYYGFWGLGHYVVIEHEQGFKSTYGHMGRIFVKKGDNVTSVSIIGEVGLTGNTTGPHTHLEIARNNQSFDPLTILPSLPELAVAYKPKPVN